MPAVLRHHSSERSPIVPFFVFFFFIFHAFDDHQQACLHDSPEDVARDARVVALAADLVDLSMCDPALRALDVVIEFARKLTMMFRRSSADVGRLPGERRCGPIAT